MTIVEDLALYQYPSCMFCERVRDVIEQLGIGIELRDIHAEPGSLRELVEATGRQTVPCLRIESDGETQWMHESSVIAAYLQERFGSAS